MAAWERTTTSEVLLAPCSSGANIAKGNVIHGGIPFNLSAAIESPPLISTFSDHTLVVPGTHSNSLVGDKLTTRLVRDDESEEMGKSFGWTID